MNTLVIVPRGDRLALTTFMDARQGAASDDQVDLAGDWTGELVERLTAWTDSSHGSRAVAVYVPYAGDVLREPVLADDAVVTSLNDIVPEAPLVLGQVLELIRVCREASHDLPVVLVSGTAFFADLPPREAAYALDPARSPSVARRRTGLQGLFHQAACAAPPRQATRRLSIYLGTRPELVAAIGDRPVMVAGGATLLEGLPGDRTCGAIDPAIVLRLVQHLDGAQRVNDLLTRHSGWRGLTGRDVTLPQLFDSIDPADQFARRVFEHRLLQASGAALAAATGVDLVIFTGPYRGLASHLGPWLIERLPLYGPRPEWRRVDADLAGLIHTQCRRTLIASCATAQLDRSIGVFA